MGWSVSVKARLDGVLDDRRIAGRHELTRGTGDAMTFVAKSGRQEMSP